MRRRPGTPPLRISLFLQRRPRRRIGAGNRQCLCHPYVALTGCDPGEDCDDNGQSRWRLLFATAAHVVTDVCALQKATPPATIRLVVPALADRASKSDFRLPIDAAFCTENAEAANYSNNLYAIAREDGRSTNAKTLPDNDLRKNSDQWFFAADIETPTDDYVRPLLIGPLRQPRQSSDGIPLRFQAFQNAPAENAKAIEEGVWWTTSGKDYLFTQKSLASAYEAEGWTTIKGASGSPVLERLAGGKQVRAIGITTRFAYIGCSKAAGMTRRPDAEPVDDGGDPAAMTASDLARCLNDPATGEISKGRTTSFIPVLRFPPQLRERFAKLGAGVTKAQVGWMRSPELLVALRALVRRREKAFLIDDKDRIDDDIRLLTSDMPPHEVTFVLSGMSQSANPRNKVSAESLSVIGCRRIEPPLGQPS